MAAMVMTAETGRARVKGRFPVAAQTGRALARYQELVMDGPVRIVADAAPVAHRVMFEHKGPSHFLVTVEAQFVVIE